MFGLSKTAFLWIIGVTMFSTLLSAGITQLWYQLDSQVTHLDVLSVAILIPMICAPVCTFLGMKSRQKIEALAAENERLAHTDVLTGLPNRRAFFSHIEDQHAIGQNRPHPVTFIVCDIDRFKHFNDRFGHATGDAVLVHVARLIGEALPARAFVARIGGEEFAIRFDSRNDETDVDQIADHLVDSIAGQPLLLNGAVHNVTLSVGVCVSDTATPPDRALFKADQAMYAAKSNGRNQFVRAA